MFANAQPCLDSHQTQRCLYRNEASCKLQVYRLVRFPDLVLAYRQKYSNPSRVVYLIGGLVVVVVVVVVERWLWGGGLRSTLAHNLRANLAREGLSRRRQLLKDITVKFVSLCVNHHKPDTQICLTLQPAHSSGLISYHTD
ncbi:hypothetical protein J6590_039162 [Homalodisca vitripennis]|nr:hypothetical protein J6590_039162 [Homalodisca vitripennis]